MKPIRCLFTWIAAVALSSVLACSGRQHSVQTTRIWIPSGMRAVSLRANLGAPILPGMHVDVFVTDNAHQSNVLKDVEVAGCEQLKRETIVTLFTSPKDAEKLTLAVSKGRIQLIPRN
jgi:Flp pilus assembly protein CpaB